MKKKLIDFIHVGDYKTGTTWLQKYIFPHHPEINYLGDYFSNIKLEKILWELVDSRDLDFNANKLQEDFLNNIKNLKDKKVGISREALAASNFITGENAKRNTIRLKQVFGKTKIIYVIREQYSMIETLYSEYIKSGGSQSFRNWFLNPYSCKSLLDRLQYHKNIAMYYSIFGKNNVLVLLYDELQSDPKIFVKKILKFIGCKNFNFYPNQASKKINTSLTCYGATFARFCNFFIRNTYFNQKNYFIPIDKIIKILMPIYLKKRLIRYSEKILIPSYGKIDEDQRLLYCINNSLLRKIRTISEKIRLGGKIKIDIKPEYKKEINKLFIHSNRKLRDYYKLNIDSDKWKI